MMKFCLYFFFIASLIGCTSDYQKGEKELFLEHYENALFLFQKVEKENQNYPNAQLKIVEIRNKLNTKTVFFETDTIEKGSEKAEEKRDNFVKVEPNVMVETPGKSLNEAKQKVKHLYDLLMHFKNKSDFHEYGFAVCCQYNKWMEEVDSLRHSHHSDALESQGYSLIDLQQIGLVYLRSNGKETEFTKYAKKRSLWAVK